MQFIQSCDLLPSFTQPVFFLHIEAIFILITVESHHLALSSFLDICFAPVVLLDS